MEMKHVRTFLYLFILRTNESSAVKKHPSKLASCCVMLCDYLTQCVKIVPFASCCVFTQCVILSDVVLSRSASNCAVMRDHTLLDIA